jgi:hypothetical protein
VAALDVKFATGAATEQFSVLTTKQAVVLDSKVLKTLSASKLDAMQTNATTALKADQP